MLKNNNVRMVNDQSSMNAYIKSVCDIMLLDEKEEVEELKCQAVGKSFTPSLKEPYRWRDWGNPYGKKKAHLANIRRLIIKDG